MDRLRLPPFRRQGHQEPYSESISAFESRRTILSALASVTNLAVFIGRQDLQPIGSSPDLFSLCSGHTTSAPGHLPLRDNIPPIPPLLTLADSFGVIGGVPAFVLDVAAAQGHNACIYDICYNGTRLVLSAPQKRLCAYNVHDSFSLIGENQGPMVDEIIHLKFWEGKSDAFLTVSSHGIITLFKITVEATTSDCLSNEDSVQLGSIERKEEYMLSERSTMCNNLNITSASTETEMWLCGIETCLDSVFYLVSLTESGFQRLQITPLGSINATHAYISVFNKALLIVDTFPDAPTKNRTRMICNFECEGLERRENPRIVIGRSFGWNVNDKYYVIWKVTENDENWLNTYLYSDMKFTRGAVFPYASTLLGSHLRMVLPRFLDQTTSTPLHIKDTRYLSRSIVTILVVSSSTVKLLFWEIHLNQIVQTMNLPMKNMNLAENIHIDYAVCPNLQWIAVGFWSTELDIGLYSLPSETLVWNTKLDWHHALVCSPNLIRFDKSGTRLCVNAGCKLYIFAPSCLTENYNVYSRSLKYRISHGFDESVCDLPYQFQDLITKNILHYLVSIELEANIYNTTATVLDVAYSVRVGRLVVLVHKESALYLFVGSFSDICSVSFRDFLRHIPEDQSFTRIDRKRVTEVFSETIKIKEHLAPCCVFLYSENGMLDSSVALFCLTTELWACFIAMENGEEQHLECFSQDECFHIKQRSDGSAVTCLGTQGVFVIDLEQKCVLHEVKYDPAATQWLHEHCAPKSYYELSISKDCMSLLAGWDQERMKPVIITSETNSEQVEQLRSKFSQVLLCWALTDDLKKLAYVEFDETDARLSRICLFDTQTNFLRCICRDDWNLDTKLILNKLAFQYTTTYALRLDKYNGHLCLMGIVKVPSEACFELICVSITPYSLESCIPSLHMIGYPQQTLTEDVLEKSASRFGHAFYHMTFTGISNFQLVIRHDDRTMLYQLVKLAIKHGIHVDQIWFQEQSEHLRGNIVANSISSGHEDIVKLFIYVMESQFGSFEQNARVMRQCFQDLWKEYRTLVERVITKNLVGWPISEIEVPSDIFIGENYAQCRVGTCSKIDDWKQGLVECEALTEWKGTNAEQLKNIELKGSSSTGKAVVKVFCFEQVCKTGTGGIIRFLLMQNTPSHVFRTPLVRAVITWKWEYIWRRRCFLWISAYAVFLVGFSLYAVLIVSYDHEWRNVTEWKAGMVACLSVLMVLASAMLFQEWNQLNTYMKDGKKLHPDHYCWGAIYYFRSTWRLTKAITYTIMLILIPALHMLSMFNSSFLRFLHVCIAFETLLVWIQLWYFALPYRQSAPLVLMINNVVRDSVPFLILTGAVLLGFGFALHTLFQYSLGHEDHNHEMKKTINMYFGSTYKTMITMFCAMIGSFDTEVYLYAGSHWVLITLLFILFLAVQLVVMLNLLIALMGDTFDRVKNSEEEHLLLGRARFIDSYEASLLPNQIKHIESQADDYLYILDPVKKNIDSSSGSWKGRIKSIEDSIGSLISQSEETILARLQKQERTIASLEDRIEDQKKDFQQRIKHIEEKMISSEAFDRFEGKTAMQGHIQDLVDRTNHEMKVIQKQLEENAIVTKTIEEMLGKKLPNDPPNSIAERS